MNSIYPEPETLEAADLRSEGDGMVLLFFLVVALIATYHIFFSKS